MAAPAAAAARWTTWRRLMRSILEFLLTAAVIQPSGEWSAGREYPVVVKPDVQAVHSTIALFKIAHPAHHYLKKFRMQSLLGLASRSRNVRYFEQRANGHADWQCPLDTRSGRSLPASRHSFHKRRRVGPTLVVQAAREFFVVQTRRIKRSWPHKIAEIRQCRLTTKENTQ